MTEGLRDNTCLTYYFQVNAHTHYTGYDYEDDPMVLATFGELDHVLANYTDRYSMEGTHDDNSFDYTFKITGGFTSRQVHRVVNNCTGPHSKA